MTSVDGVVQEIMRIHRSLPARPALEEVEAAKLLIGNVDKGDDLRLENISQQKKPRDVPQELFDVLLDMQRNLIYYQSKEQKREAIKLLDLENVHLVFDELIQRASTCLPISSSGSTKSNDYASSSGATKSNDYAPPAYSNGSSLGFSSSNGGSGGGLSDLSLSSSSGFFYNEKESVKSKEMFSRDDTYVKKAKASFYDDRVGMGGFSPKPQIVDSTLRPVASSGQDGENLSLIKLASFIEVSSKKGTKEINLQNKLLDQVEWLPDSIGKLSGLITLDLSENRLVALPNTIGGLTSLTKLDLHSNRIGELPEAIGNLLNLVFLDLRNNQLATLPATFGKLVRLEELDLSSNRLSSLPDVVGHLVKLKKLTVETNDIEELPHTIGQCSSLKELHADYNRLKGLPEAVGKIESLEILSVRYNNIKQLPTTMSSLINLRELDVSFNELESVPESLCFATSLVKMNVGNNFADLRSLPRSIGNLEMLEELDISNNQIRFLPDSFRMLTQLRVLRVEENPLEVPPRHIADKGAQAVVQYMADLAANKDIKIQPMKQKKGWAQLCCFSRSNKRKRGGMDNLKT